MITDVSTLEVLLVEGDETSAALVRDALAATRAPAFNTTRPLSVRAALAAAAEQMFDVVLWDMDGADGVNAGDTTGFDHLGAILATYPEAAVVAITKTADEQLTLAAIGLGAQDCLTLDPASFDKGAFIRAVCRAAARATSLTNRRFASLNDLSPDAIVTVNRDRRITSFNHAAERIYGYRAWQVLDQPSPMLITTEREAEQRAFVERVLAGEAVEAFETTRMRTDGVEVPVSITGTPITADPHGGVIEACAIVRDLSEVVLQRARLDQQQQRLSKSQAAAHIGSWEVDLSTMQIAWSAEEFRLHKRDPALGPPTIEELLETVHPEDRELVRAGLSSSAAFEHEYRMVLDPDDPRTLLSRGEFQPGEGDHPGWLVATTVDVTSERAQRAALEAAEEQSRRSFDEALIGMVIADLEGRHFRINDAFCQLVGRSREELLGTTFEEITHPDDFAGNLRVVELLAGSEQKSNVRQKRYIHADGHTIWAEVSVAAIHDQEGKTAYYAVQILDITERHGREEELRELADHDPLTGALNRRGFDALLAAQVAQSDRYGTTGALLMIDLDNFKHHNDTYGHNAGDQLLIAITLRLRERLRAGDAVARLGGDEFAVLLPYADDAQATDVANDLIDEIRQTSQTLTSADDGAVSASIAIACFRPNATLSATQMLGDADKALYEAKAHGRNRVACYNGG